MVIAGSGGELLEAVELLAAELDPISNYISQCSMWTPGMRAFPHCRRPLRHPKWARIGSRDSATGKDPLYAYVSRTSCSRSNRRLGWAANSGPVAGVLG